MFNATFNNISVILWRSVLLVEKKEDTEKTTDLSQVTDKLYHIMVYTPPWSRFEPTTSVVNEESTGLWLRQMEHTRSNLWQIFRNG